MTIIEMMTAIKDSLGDKVTNIVNGTGVFGGNAIKVTIGAGNPWYEIKKEIDTLEVINYMTYEYTVPDIDNQVTLVYIIKPEEA